MAIYPAKGVVFRICFLWVGIDLQADAWIRRAMNTTEKNGYIDAVLCLAKRPSKAQATIKGAKSRYDDFQGIHSAQTDHIHWVVSTGVTHIFLSLD